MGALPAPPPGTQPWRVHYVGGGPLDGQEEPVGDPRNVPIVHLTGELLDGPFCGQYVYIRGAPLPGSRTVEMAFRGERWGPRIA